MSVTTRRAVSLIDAIKDETDHRLRTLLDDDLDPNEPVFGITPLCYAIELHKPQFVKILLAYGADFNQSAGGVTPLRWCIVIGETACADVLLRWGAVGGIDDLHAALQFRYYGICRDVLRYGIETTHRTALETISSEAPIDVVRRVFFRLAPGTWKCHAHEIFLCALVYERFDIAREVISIGGQSILRFRDYRTESKLAPEQRRSLQWMLCRQLIVWRTASDSLLERHRGG
jgi:hypothetical protein